MAVSKHTNIYQLCKEDPLIFGLAMIAECVEWKNTALFEMNYYDELHNTAFSLMT